MLQRPAVSALQRVVEGRGWQTMARGAKQPVYQQPKCFSYFPVVEKSKMNNDILWHVKMVTKFKSQCPFSSCFIGAEPQSFIHVLFEAA